MTLMPSQRLPTSWNVAPAVAAPDALNAIGHPIMQFTVYGIAKDVEHPRENRLANRRFQRPAGVLHRHAASETLRWSQSNPAHATRIFLRQHFDDDLLFRSREQHRVNRRQMGVEPNVHDTAAHRDDYAGCVAG